MGIEFNHCLGASIYGEELKKSIFEKVNEGAYSATTFIGLALPIGICLACITLATKIATVGEVIFKAIANIGGGLLGKEGFNAKLGAKQLCFALPASIIDLIFGAPLHMTYNIIGDTLGTASQSVTATIRNVMGNVIEAVEYTGNREAWHERKIEQLEAAKTKSAAFRTFYELTRIDPDDEEIPTRSKRIFSAIGGIIVLSNSHIYGDWLPETQTADLRDIVR